MSASNGDKARFHRERKRKIARRARHEALRKKMTTPPPEPPSRGQSS